MKNWIIKGAGLVVMAIVLMGGTPVRADSIEPTGLTITSLGGGVYDWLYEVSISKAGQLLSGAAYAQFFTIYDFFGYIAGSAYYCADAACAAPGTTAAGTWTFSAQPFGIDPTAVPPTGAASPLADGVAPNLTWTWDNSLVATFDPAGGGVIGYFGAHTKENISKLGEFGMRDTLDLSGAPSNFVSAVPVPTPEPATLLLLGTGLLGLGGAARRKLRKRANKQS